MSTLDWVGSANSPPKRTRNISGKTSAKKTEVLSRMNPFTIASDSASNAPAEVMRGTPDR